MRRTAISLSCLITLAVSVTSPVASAPSGEQSEYWVLETVAGTGQSGDFVDGVPAVDANLDSVNGLAIDDAGNIYIATGSGHGDLGAEGTYIRKVAPDATISTVAGGVFEDANRVGFDITADGLASVDDLAIGASDELYIVDYWAATIMRLDPGGQPTVIAGTGDFGHSGDGGPATQARLDFPVSVAVGNAGDLYVADRSGYIRRIDADGVITTIAGTGEADESSGDGGPATEASFAHLTDVEVDAAGNIYVADDNRIRRIDTDGVITTIAGGQACGFSGDGGPAADADLCFPSKLAVAPDGTIYLIDNEHRRIRTISPDGSIDTLPVYVEDPRALAIGPDGALYVGDSDFLGQVHRISLKQAPTTSNTPTGPPDPWAEAEPGVVTAVAGTGSSGYSGDGGPALDAQLSEPYDLAVGPDGSLMVFDSGNNRVRAIQPGGTIATVAGNGSVIRTWPGPGLVEGDGRLATDASVGNNLGIDLASDGTLFIADHSSSRVRTVESTGVITTVAGGDGLLDSYEPLVPDADTVLFEFLEDVAVAPDGSLYVSDSRAHQVLRIDPDGTVQVAAGYGVAGYSGDGGPADSARLSGPSSVEVGTDGTVYIADQNQTVVRAITPDGVLSTVAGTEAPPTRGSSPEDALATDVYLAVFDLAVDDTGTIYISTPRSISAVGSDGGITRLISDTSVGGVAVDGAGNLYFSQPDNHQVSVLPRVHEDVAPATAGGAGVPWMVVIIGVLLVVGMSGGYVVYRRRSAALKD